MRPDAFVDLRSDTLTQPTAAMRAAMADAPVGDDVYGEDPTVAALESAVAQLFGRETALFVPSGTMANQIALMLHCRPGDAVFCGADTHLARYESGAAGAFAGVQFFEVGPGIFTPEQLEAKLHPDVFYYPRPRLLSIENTHNHSGGRVYTRDAFTGLVECAREHELVVHLDGARIWNASVATGESLVTLAGGADTVSVCFSKGLGAPLGSALLMDTSRREEALRYRRRMGGAMRQAGIVAAGALHALEHHRGDLAADHRRALSFAQTLADGGVACDATAVETNMVVFDVEGPAADFVQRIRDRVGLSAIAPHRIRAVTHRDLDDDQVASAAQAILQLVRS